MSTRRPAPPATWITWLSAFLGVALPATALGLELWSHICLAMGIDPLPTSFHAVGVATVPLMIGAGLLALHGRWKPQRLWIDRGLGFVQGFALGYTALLWPLTWMGAWVATLGWAFLLNPGSIGAEAALIPLSWLALSPAVSFLVGLLTRWRLRKRQDASARAGRFRWPLLGLLMLLLGELPSLLVPLGVRTALPLPLPESVWVRAHDLGLQRVGLLQHEPFQTREVAFLDEETLLRRTGRLRAAFGPLSLPGRDGALRSLVESLGLNDRGRADFRTELPVASLVLTRSEMMADLQPAYGSGYLEWTFVLENEGGEQEEARAQIQLPPGAAVSRATLWVNGIPREAAVGHRSRAVEAYQRVVTRRRDPLLVTSQGVDRVFINAFPIPPQGSMKFRLGISFPMNSTDRGRAAQFLPRLGARNFGSPSSLLHEFRWRNQGLTRLRFEGLGRTVNPEASQPLHFRDVELRRGVILVAEGLSSKSAAFRDRRSPGLPGIQVSTEALAVDANRPVLVVVDGSRALREHQRSLADWVQADHPRPLLGVLIAGEERGLQSPSDAAKRLRGARFSGGSDNAPTLEHAIEIAEREGAEILWIRGPQILGDTGAALLPRLRQAGKTFLFTEIAVTPSPDPFEGRRGVAAWLSVPFTGRLREDLSRIDRDWAEGVRGYTSRRIRSAGPSGSGTEVAAIQAARLLARAEVIETALSHVDAAVEIASRYEIVTPWSGAVVLETDGEYERAGLTTPGRQADDPGRTDPGAVDYVEPPGAAAEIAAPIPEPGAAILFVLGFLMLRWTTRRHPPRLR